MLIRLVSFPKVIILGFIILNQINFSFYLNSYSSNSIVHLNTGLNGALYVGNMLGFGETNFFFE